MQLEVAPNNMIKNIHHTCISHIEHVVSATTVLEAQILITADSEFPLPLGKPDAIREPHLSRVPDRARLDQFRVDKVD